MNRVIVTFLGLLALATVAAGQLWTQVELLGAGRAQGHPLLRSRQPPSSAPLCSA